MRKDSREREERQFGFKNLAVALLTSHPQGMPLSMLVSRVASSYGVNYHTGRRYLDVIMAEDDRVFTIYMHHGRKMIRAITDQMLEAEARSVLDNYTEPRPQSIVELK